MQARLLIVTALISVMLLPPFGAAAEKKEERLQEVVVTATRTETSEREVASSVTVITADDLEKRQSRQVLEVLREVPAVDVVQSGGPGGTTAIFLRGAKSEHTLVLVDGVEINDPSTPGRIADLAYLTTDNVERIEIVRGPQSVLYGSDAMGGVINIITKRGYQPRLELWGEGGSYDSRSFGASATTATDHWHFATGLSYQATDGISRATDAVAENTEDDRYINRTLSARAGFSGPEDIVDLDFIYRFSSVDSDLDNGTGRNPNNDDPNHVTEVVQSFLRTQVGVNLLAGRWRQVLAFDLADQKRETVNESDPKHSSTSWNQYLGRTSKLGWQHSIDLYQQNTITAGIEYEREWMNSASNWGDEPEQEVGMRGYYLQDQLSVADMVFVTAGVRQDNHDRFGNETTWRLAPAVFFDQIGTKVKGTYGTGFKAPSLFQLFDPTYGNPDLQPETSKGWDAGVEQYLFDDSLILGLTYFENDFEDLIVWDSAASTYKNIDKAKTRGLEATVEILPMADLRLTISYTYTDTKDRSDGARLIRRPLHKGSASVTYAFLQRATATATLVYVGERDDTYFPPWPQPARTVILDDYTLVNLAATFDLTRQLRLFARVENLLDEDYEEVYGYGTPGLSAYAGLKLILP